MSDALIGFIGAIIGGICTLIGTLMINNHAKKEAKRTEEESIKAFLQAIEAELTTLWDLYFQGAGIFLESKKVRCSTHLCHKLKSFLLCHHVE